MYSLRWRIFEVLLQVMAATNEVRLLVCQLYSSGHYFVATHPPLILFAVCIILFILMLSSLSYYVAVTEHIRNPDVSKV